MSLIHDALKKAEGGDKARLGSGLISFQEPFGGRGPRIPKRTVILAVILLLAIAFFAYTKLAPQKGGGGIPVTAVPVPPTQSDSAGALQLKSSAVQSFRSNDVESAWAQLQAVSRVYSTDPEVWNNLGVVAKKRGDAMASRGAYLKALELRPDYPEALNNLAVLELQSGKTAEAKGLLERATEILPAYPEANFHLALIYDEGGDKTRAAEYYRRFLNAGGDYPSHVVDAIRNHIVEIEGQ